MKYSRFHVRRAKPRTANERTENDEITYETADVILPRLSRTIKNGVLLVFA